VALVSALRILVGDRALLVPLEAVEAVLRTPPMTPVPGTPRALAGLFNHQGVVYPAVHPLEEAPSGGRHAVIVRTRAHGRFALLCDWAEDLDARDGEPLDLDAVARGVIASYQHVDAGLPTPERPSAVIRLKGRSYTQSDAAP
jgi:chemotaxis signal transduction protein